MKKFEELKKCKTIKELYETIGMESFEKPAQWILYLWALMPIFSIWSHFYWGYRNGFREGRDLIIWASYRDMMLLISELTWIFLAVYALGCILTKYKRDVRSEKRPWNYCFLGMFLWSVLATICSQDVNKSFWGSEYRYEGLLTYFFYVGVFCLAHVVSKEENRLKYFRVFAGIANVMSLALFLQDAGVPYVKDVFYIPRATVFFQFNHMGYYLCMSTLCAVGLFFYEKKRKGRIFALVSAAIQLTALLVNSTLGAYLGVLVGFIALILLSLVMGRHQQKTVKRPISARWLGMLVLIVMITLLSYFGMIPTSSGEDMRVNIETMVGDTNDLLTGENDSVGHGRMTLWKTGLKMIPKHPLVGYGPENIDEELTATIWNDRIDNEFMQYAIFLGIPGALLYLMGLVLLAWNRIKNLKYLSYSVLIAAGCVFGYLFSSCLGNSMFYTAPYFWIFLGMVEKEPKRAHFE